LKQRKEKQTIAMERIQYLYNSLNKTDEENKIIRIRLMENLGKRADVAIPTYIKRSYCKNCKNLYDKNTRIRLKDGNLIISCGKCGDIRRIRYRH
jgi:RNase P subunit RPR2